MKSGPFEWLYIALNFVLTEWLASNDGDKVSDKFFKICFFSYLVWNGGGSKIANKTVLLSWLSLTCNKYMIQEIILKVLCENAVLLSWRNFYLKPKSL